MYRSWVTSPLDIGVERLQSARCLQRCFGAHTSILGLEAAPDLKKGDTGTLGTCRHNTMTTPARDEADAPESEELAPGSEPRPGSSTLTSQAR
jgi:hypothetical protein